MSSRELNDPVEFMRLTLFYRGPLHAQNKHNAHIEEKHAIRKYIHKQLMDLWETHPALDGHLEKWKALNDTDQIRNNGFITAFDNGQFRFVPLVTKRLWLSCELDILFLCHEPFGYIVDNESADIDNRIKVLFDALQMPKVNSSKIPPTAQPEPHERPFLCLLEEDALITRFSVETDRLLSRQMTTDSEVELVIRVTIKVIRLFRANMGLGG